MLLRTICGISVVASPPPLLGSRCSAKWKRYGCAENHFQEIDDERGRSGLPKGARGLEVLLVHPGGPFWRKKDGGAWSIPKGEMDGADAPEQVARRELAEELGPSASIGLLRPLGEIRQRGGKRVIAFAGEGRFNPAALTSNTFEIEWPPRTGQRQSFPEVDRAEWFDLDFARTKMLSAQVELLDRLSASVSVSNIE